MSNAMMFPPMFPTSILKDPQSMAKTFPSYKFGDPQENKEELNKQIIPHNIQEDRKFDRQSNPSAYSSSSSSISNSDSPDRNITSLPDVPEGKSEKEQNHSSGEKDAGLPNTNKRKRKSACQLDETLSLPRYTELLQEQYKTMLPLLISQWQANGTSKMINYHNKSMDAPKEKEERSSLERKTLKDSNEENEPKRIKTDVKNKLETSTERRISEHRTKKTASTLRKSLSEPNNLNNIDFSPQFFRGISESFSDPGKQSPSRSEEDVNQKDNRQENEVQKYEEEKRKRKNLEQRASLGSIPNPVSTSNSISFPFFRSSAMPNNLPNKEVYQSLNRVFSSTYKHPDFEAELNKDTSSNSGGEIHGGVWIPTRSRNCHLCGKEFKNVYR